MTTPTLRFLAYSEAKRRGLPERLCDIPRPQSDILRGEDFIVLSDGTKVTLPWNVN